MPALQTFCLQSAIAIIFNYLLEIFTFVVILIYDEERKKSKRVDVACCLKSSAEIKEPRNFWKKHFGTSYYNLLTSKPCQWAVLAIGFLLLALAIVGLFFVPVGLNEQVSMEIGSDLYDYFTYEKKYIEIGPPAYIVLNNFDFRNDTHIDKIS